MTTDQVLKLLTVVVSLLSLLGVGTIMTLFWKEKHEKKRQELSENSQLREQRKLDELKNLIGNALDEKLRPVISELDEIKGDISKLKYSAQCSNRCDLDDIFEKADKQQ